MKSETEILEKNWKNIVSKVIKPLWTKEFQLMYKSKRLDYDDFESLAGYELTKAFAHYDASKSAVLTYATNVLKIKSKTELRNESRDKRSSISSSVSVDDKISEDSEKTFGDIIKNSTGTSDNTSELEEMLQEILSQLKPKEAKILNLACDGYNNQQIADSLNLPLKYVTSIRKKISESSNIKRIARKYGFFGGEEDEI